jgi:hypothetical protein
MSYTQNRYIVKGLTKTEAKLVDSRLAKSAFCRITTTGTNNTITVKDKNGVTLGSTLLYAAGDTIQLLKHPEDSVSSTGEIIISATNLGTDYTNNFVSSEQFGTSPGWWQNTGCSLKEDAVATSTTENITATQDYIPVTATQKFTDNATGQPPAVAKIGTEDISFTSISRNDLSYSQGFDNAFWGKLRSTVTAAATTAPDGTLTAYKATQAAGQTGNGIVQIASAHNVTADKSYTLSIFAKKGDNRNFLCIKETMSKGGGGISHWFNLDTGAVGGVGPSTGSGTPWFSTATMSDEGNGWYRCSVKFIADATRTGGIMWTISESDVSNSNTDDQGFIYLWGAQLETEDDSSSILTTYLPTTSAGRLGLTGATRGVNGTTAASANSGATITQQYVAPNGTNTASKWMTTEGSGDYHYMGDTFTAVHTKTYTFSIYAKAAELTRVIMWQFPVGISTWPGGEAFFNLTGDGTVENSNYNGTITKVGTDGWYRITIKYTADVAGGSSTIAMGGIADGEANQTWLPGNDTDGVYFWGGQVEEAGTAGPYIPTYGVIRTETFSADEITATGLIV